MNGILTHLRLPALISTALTLPFILLEAINRRGYAEPFPLPVFGFLWLLPLTFLVILTSLVRELRPADGLRGFSLSIFAKAVGLIVIAWIWAALIQDQWLCFLGVPNCD